MKQILAILCLSTILASCNNEGTKTTEPATTENKTNSEVKLPFALAGPYNNWTMGSTENVVAAMSSLKAFIDKDFTAMAATIGDSLEVDFDYLQAKMSRDSAVKFFTAGRSMYNDLTVTLYDYVSVISADKKAEWVTLWYKQTWKDAKGVADSMNVVNDIRLVNGKMVELDEKTSHFQKK